jgi:DNA repair exonuclease SbcCD ATPase subunit
MESDLIESKLYEENLKRYKSDKERYDKLLSEIEEKKEAMSEIDNEINGLTEFMTRVKNSIIPSLSKVSSELVSEMSGGETTEIKINDDFEITADGKEICLLSGGEEAGVNLAIRLALSSILTRKVFNVFIGDEVDQSMDDERAELTANTLRNLNKQIEQMILISHKDVEGDYIIDI